ncbi:hypothetical protein PRZ48_014482 [Zasmidium cellare]|uniref:Lariat debranching enzyme C-terminal domain-containing protein n=1 Tax=Zasmidium cellare TaxID=395010 RepID=A0ABR0DYD9_ZASCE|nr:hypothetical protein PRZ48_014482 [Zasmidium cellare]
MDLQLEESNGVRLAIEGCGHGTLHAIYASVEEACKQKGWPGVDLLIIGGDFQSVRNAFDLNCVSMPPKYRSMCDFHEYYSGQRTAPCLTVFVGGNHEASNYLFELYYGGWVAPNIYYMGAANVLKIGPIRIAGLSGIWKGFDYRKTHFERLPYNESDMKSIYHVREMDIRKLLQVGTQVDIGISHDWPQGVEWKGNWKQLFNFKKYFEEDARSGKLGSMAANQVLDRLRPRYWFSAHLHCKYAAKVSHEQEEVPQQSLPGIESSKDTNAGDVSHTGGPSNGLATIPKNADEIDLDLDDDSPSEATQGLHTTPATAVSTAPKNADEIDLELDDDDAEQPSAQHTETAKATEITGPTNPTSPNGDTLSLEAARAALPASFAKPKAQEPMEHPPEISNKETSFLALDKCLPNRHFLQLLSVPTPDADTTSTNVELARPLKLEYDREWLSIARAFAFTERPAFGDPDARVPPAKSQAEYRNLIAEHRTWIDSHLSESDLVIPENFEAIAPAYDGGHFQDVKYQQVQEYPNPQTARFCELLGIDNPLEISEEERAERLAAGPRPEEEFNRFGGGRGRGGFDRGRGRGGRGGRGRGGGRGRFRGR